MARTKKQKDVSTSNYKVYNLMANPFVCNLTTKPSDYYSINDKTRPIIPSGGYILVNKEIWNNYVKNTPGAISLIDTKKLMVYDAVENKLDASLETEKFQKIDSTKHGLENSKPLSNGKNVETSVKEVQEVEEKDEPKRA